MKNNITKSYKKLLLLLAGSILLGGSDHVFAQAESPKEDDYFKIKNITAPAGSILEIGGLCTLPNGTLAATTRRGDIFMIQDPHTQNPIFKKFASGLHEVLGGHSGAIDHHVPELRTLDSATLCPYQITDSKLLFSDVITQMGALNPTELHGQACRNVHLR